MSAAIARSRCRAYPIKREESHKRRKGVHWFFRVLCMRFLRENQLFLPSSFRPEAKWVANLTNISPMPVNYRCGKENQKLCNLLDLI